MKEIQCHPSPYPDRRATLETRLRGCFGRATRLADDEFCNVELACSVTPSAAKRLERMNPVKTPLNCSVGFWPPNVVRFSRMDFYSFSSALSASIRCHTYFVALKRTSLMSKKTLRPMSVRYGACPKNETCAFSEGLTHHCTGAGCVGYEKFLD